MGQPGRRAEYQGNPRTWSGHSTCRAAWHHLVVMPSSAPEVANPGPSEADTQENNDPGFASVS